MATCVIMLGIEKHNQAEHWMAGTVAVPNNHNSCPPLNMLNERYVMQVDEVIDLGKWESRFTRTFKILVCCAVCEE